MIMNFIKYKWWGMYVIWIIFRLIMLVVSYVGLQTIKYNLIVIMESNGNLINYVCDFSSLLCGTLSSLIILIK